MGKGAWWAAVHGVAKSQTRLSNFTFTFHFHGLEKEMATHSSVLAWRIPGMGEPGGLLSVGLHRVRHDWSDLAAAAASLFLPSVSSFAQSCPTLRDPMDCNTPGLPVHHQLLELTQTYVYQVGNAIQPSHPLSSSSLPAFNLFSITVFSNKLALRIRWPKYWSFSFSINWLVGSPWNPKDSRESSPTPQFKSINSLALSFLYGPTLMSIHDYWKNHSFD